MFRIAAATLPLALVACSSTTGSNPNPTNSGTYADLVQTEVPVTTEILADARGLPREDPTDPRQTVGVDAAVNARVELSSLGASDIGPRPRDIAGGAIAERAPMTFVWSAVISAPGAAAIRLSLTDMYLPRNAELYVYNDAGDVAGPYTRRGPDQTGELTTHTVRGDRLHLQLRYSGSDTDRVLDLVRFTIAGVGVLDDRFTLARFGGAANKVWTHCSFNEDCVQDAESSNIPTAVAKAQKAVALMLFKSGAYWYICTGGLIADSDTSSDIPLFLTAHHCLSRGKEAKTLETFFNFTTTSTPNGCDDIPSTATTVGATVLASNRTGDYTLLRLDQPAPAGAEFLGYNTTPVANSTDTLYRISHPGGAPQAYSEHVVDPDVGTCSSWPRGSWIYSRDIYGATEGGSSGSPVLNSQGQIVGQLSGGCGTNVYEVCDNVSNATVDGAFASYFNEVSQILDPGAGCTDADGDTYCAPDDCDDNNASVYPGATELCTDNIDNDCDGTVNEGCGGTCDAGQVGDVCNDNSECCSNKCRGRRGTKHCR